MIGIVGNQKSGIGLPGCIVGDVIDKRERVTSLHEAFCTKPNEVLANETRVTVRVGRRQSRPRSPTSQFGSRMQRR